jgi:hypothetical protein
MNSENKKPEPIVISANAVFSLAEARTALGLAKATIAREVRLGRLRVSKRAGKYFFLGSWLLEWIAGGELIRKTRRQGAALNGDCEARP